MKGICSTHSIVSLVKEATDDTMPDDDPIVVVEPTPADPVVSTPMMKVQPTELERIPIDEDDYVPTHAAELARATKLLFRDLPDEVSGWMWKRVKDLRARVDQSMHDKGATMNSEARIRQAIRHIIAEARPLDVEGEGPSAADLAAIEDDPDWESTWEKKWGRDTKKPAMAHVALSDADADMLAAIRAQAEIAELEDEEDPADRAAEEDKRRRKYNTKGEEGMSLKDIAEKMGYAGPSGVKNLLYKLEDRLRYFEGLDEVWFKRLMHEFARAYVDELQDAGGSALTRADIEFLQDMREDLDSVIHIPEFRVWAADYIKDIHKQGLGKKSRY